MILDALLEMNGHKPFLNLHTGPLVFFVALLSLWTAMLWTLVAGVLVVWHAMRAGRPPARRHALQFGLMALCLGVVWVLLWAGGGW